MKLSAGDRVFLTIVAIVLVLMFAVFAYPLLIILSTSFSSPTAVAAGKVKLFPVDWSLAGYKTVFDYKDIWIGYGNSLYYAAVGTALNLFMTIAAAYPLSRPDFKARNAVMLFFTLTMFFSGGLIPTYLMMNSLRLLNTRLVMILPGAMSVFNVIITRTFFQSTIPRELLEAAKIDGCSDFRFVLRIVLPLSGAIVAVNALFYAVGHWNAFFGAFIYLSDPNLMPLQIKMRTILLLNQMDITMFATADPSLMSKRAELSQLIKYALIVVSSAPVLIAYPFVQKFFVRGVMIGSLKG